MTTILTVLYSKLICMWCVLYSVHSYVSLSRSQETMCFNTANRSANIIPPSLIAEEFSLLKYYTKCFSFFYFFYLFVLFTTFVFRPILRIYIVVSIRDICFFAKLNQEIGKKLRKWHRGG